MKNFFLLFFNLVVFANIASTQNRHIVKFKNKGTSPFSLGTPSAYLSSRSIDRRTRYGIAVDSTDLPVTPRYIDSLRSVSNVTVLNVSKWLNQVTIQTTDAAALAQINAFTFVQSAMPIASQAGSGTISGKLSIKEATQNTAAINEVASIAADFYNYGASYGQVHIHNGEFLHNIGLRGQGMIIGMLDAGYLNYLTVKAFDSARANGQILDTYDFVAGETSVNEDHPHGMQCFSTIAANIPGEFVGTAPKSNFYLFRTEDAATEYPIEEHNWVCGAERVDSAGGDLISSSLGYTTFDDARYDHNYADMNGNTTIGAIGADMAAKKGLLVLNAAGNSGNDGWKFISTPADADSILAVGAVNTSGVVGSFSSYGPSSDGQVKPDVAAVGVNAVVQHPNNTIVTGNGTSFACPNMAGITSCLWQGFQEFNNMRIINALRQAGSIASAPNDRIGYGIPDVKKALVQLTKEFSVASGSASSCKTVINWTSKDMSAMKYEIERKAPGETTYIKIGDRSGSGSVFGNRNHSFSDTLINVAAGNISYRIRQVFDTAAATFTADYIDTVSVALSASCVLTGINPNPTYQKDVVLAPNPSNGYFEIKFSSTAAIPFLQIRVTDAIGKVVLQMNSSKPAGASSIPVQIGKMAKGKYIVTVYTKNGVIATKELIKL